MKKKWIRNRFPGDVGWKHGDVESGGNFRRPNDDTYNDTESDSDARLISRVRVSRSKEEPQHDGVVNIVQASSSDSNLSDDVSEEYILSSDDYELSSDSEDSQEMNIRLAIAEYEKSKNEESKGIESQQDGSKNEEAKGIESQQYGDY